jgi:hypothetical protein
MSSLISVQMTFVGEHMIMKYIEVLSPEGINEQQTVIVTAGITELDGKHIGFIDNGKPNYDVFLTRLIELLNKKFKFSGITQVRKKEKDTGVALGAAEVQKLVGCDIVLNGICD